MRVPYPDASVEAPRCDSLPIESYGVDLAEMALQRPQALSSRDAPDLGGRVIASGYNQIAVNFQTTHAGLMAHENAGAGS